MGGERASVRGDESAVPTREYVQDQSTGEVLSEGRAKADAKSAEESIGKDSWREQK